MEILPERVVTPRLVLRVWQPDDLPKMRAAITASVEHLRPWMPWVAYEPVSDSDRLDLIRKWDQEWRAGGGVVYGVFLGDEVVGGSGFHRRAGPETLEIGYWIHVDHVRRGYATELTRHLTDTALTLPGITRVEVHHDKANIASRRVPESLGFRCDGERPDEVTAPGAVGIDVAWSTDTDHWPRAGGSGAATGRRSR